ncbi:7-cyano-7-deazaguanine synthase [Duganella sp. FT92W]|uniref:7-cyano-7-deazaguanine synthase n=1 Tax=Pseudoduganella rivuli TaxID=2666085 RepID=A0A7X2IJG4_9BURK|nr:7-cyano-7-deazaguanine synthase [Pseudoduganella rivuli]MRV70628.1 7-cyano-7-deazaguanine synthase [Pseudoduganella rivuli]
MKSALLLSGGMDSLALAYWKKPDVALTVDYGQLAAEAEIAASTQVCKELGIAHHILRIDCRTLGSGDMAGTKEDNLAPASDWWPYRNQLLLTLVAMKAVALGVTQLWIGTVKSDGGHRDGTPEFVELIDRLLAYQEGGLRISAPAIDLTTSELIKLANVPPSLLAWAHSCHKANVACGQCRGCNKYVEVYQELNNDVAGLP